MDDFDLEETKAIFLEECGENVDILENGLLRMGDGESDPDLLNEVFRAAHSIKGGGATFGFAAMSELTHHMETLLDQMRSGQREVNDADVEMLLVSVDMLRHMLEEDDHEDRLGMQDKLAKAVENVSSQAGDAAAEVPDESGQSAGDEPGSAQSESAQQKTWQVKFVPNPDMMTRGNDPVLLLRELARLGETELTLNVDRLPTWGELDPSVCFLSWSISLSTTEGREAIAEVFEWAEFDCVLSIEESSVVSDVPAENDIPVGAVAESTVVEQEVAAEPPKEDSPKEVVGEKPKAAKAPQPSGESASIRIATDKIDHLINLVGELVITQSMLSRAGDMDADFNIEQLRERLVQLERNTRELQESVMRVRMMPISSAFGRVPRLVRDLSRKLDKKIDLVVEGEGTELDKTVLERMIDPLVHLVRNSLDHGIETPQQRLDAGKPETGVLTLNAYHQGSSVIIEIHDDGRGIDAERILGLAKERGVVGESDELTEEQIYQLIFAPGFSTASEVSDVSGRGVGMDVVRRNILDLGGRVDVHSNFGEGTKVVIRLPLTLAILDGQLIKVAQQMFVIPILSIVETIEISKASVSEIPGKGEICRFREEYLPLIRLAQRFEISADDQRDDLVVIVDIHGRRIGLVIDDVVGQQQVVIKVLEDNYKAVPGVAGATIMSDGSVALILDPPSLVEEPAHSNAA